MAQGTSAAEANKALAAARARRRAAAGGQAGALLRPQKPRPTAPKPTTTRTGGKGLTLAELHKLRGTKMPTKEAPSVTKIKAATGPGTAWWSKYGTAYKKWEAGAKKRAAARSR